MADKTVIFHNAVLRDPTGDVVPVKAVDNGDGSYSLAIGMAGGSGMTIGVVTLGAGEAHAGEMGGKTVMLTSELVRASGSATYIANGTLLASGSALQPILAVGRVTGGSGYITGIQLTTDKKSITPRFRVHLYNVSNPTLAVDNAVWKEMYADADKRVTFYDLGALATAADATNSDCSRVIDNTMRLPFACAAGQTSLWWGLEALDSFIAASAEKFRLKLYVEQN